ncbi:hypothetical protein BKA63DRAFT_407973 [Paraphoma chrysanthemicola]|nr:hypothetical protein BKA63DRAFT_407973 [Paraphoma chrysanthemicola]
MAKQPFELPFEAGLITTTLSFTQPAWIFYRDISLRPKASKNDLEEFLKMDLYPKRLDKVYKHLHYAGAPRCARPLHRQRLLGREITITEDISEHLVWHQSKNAKLFLKPLRAYLFDERFWRDHLCTDETLYKSACGFMLSYVWLVSWESDFRIAKELKLMPTDLEWEVWTEFVHSFTDKINTQTLHQVARRYHYGELRLSRLNRIYRYTFTTFSLRNLFRGFMSTSAWYQDVFRNNFGWILAVFAIFSVALSGMQVALMTDQLSHNTAFHAASFGFAVFTLVALATCLATIFFSWMILALYFFTAAKIYHRKVQSGREVARCSTSV